MKRNVVRDKSTWRCNYIKKIKGEKNPDLLFSVEDFGFQIRRNDSPSENEQSSMESLWIYMLHIQYSSDDFCNDYKPLIRAEQDHVVGAEAQRSSSLLYGVVALWGHIADQAIHEIPLNSKRGDILRAHCCLTFFLLSVKLSNSKYKKTKIMN